MRTIRCDLCRPKPDFTDLFDLDTDHMRFHSLDERTEAVSDEHSAVPVGAVDDASKVSKS